MPTLAIIGAQWGDEGKGKITDYLAEDADLVVRFQGGNNAGHTIKTGGEVFKLHLLPSGILHNGRLSVIGNGVVVNFADLVEEMEQLTSAGYCMDGLRISDRAHLVMNYHKRQDAAEEAYRGAKTVGTTKKGIGPAYQDKVARNGFRVGDIFEEELFMERTRYNLRLKKDLFKIMPDAGTCECTDETFRKKMEDWRSRFGKYVCDTSVLINDAIDGGKNILFEGAQGVMLDTDHGTYPYVTSSNTVAGGICAGAGVAPNKIEKVLGCLKAYTTRVGDGPFVTELHGENGKYLMEKGGEYGTTTGRGRRCGWLDLVAAEHSARLCGFTSLAIMKLDVLGGYRKINVCTGYKIDGHIVDRFPASIAKLQRAEPVYEEMDGWDDLGSAEKMAKKGFDALPENMRSYIRFIEDRLRIPADIISIGPGRSETIDRRKDWWS